MYEIDSNTNLKYYLLIYNLKQLHKYLTQIYTNLYKFLKYLDKLLYSIYMKAIALKKYDNKWKSCIMKKSK